MCNRLSIQWSYLVECLCHCPQNRLTSLSFGSSHFPHISSLACPSLIVPLQFASFRFPLPPGSSSWSRTRDWKVNQFLEQRHFPAVIPYTCHPLYHKHFYKDKTRTYAILQMIPKMRGAVKTWIKKSNSMKVKCELCTCSSAVARPTKKPWMK